MGFNFYDFLKDGNTLKDMPSITISLRSSDKYIAFDKKRMRFDRLAGDIYKDETLSRIIYWANPDIEYEFDIERGKRIRVPFPLNDVLQEISSKIKILKNR